MNLPQKLRLQKQLFEHITEEQTEKIDFSYLNHSIMTDLYELGFTEDESWDIICNVNYED